MRPTERDLMVARAVRDHLIVRIDRDERELLRRLDFNQIIEALPERGDAMSDPIKDYARAVAEATYDAVTEGLDYGDDGTLDFDAIIATVPAKGV